MSMPGNQATVPAGQAVEETLGGTAELAKPVEPGPEASQTQCPEQAADRLETQSKHRTRRIIMNKKDKTKWH